MSGRAVVIGGGVIGAACAHYLAEAGWSVTILERKTFGSGASHGNCGLVCPSHVLPLAEPGAVRATLRAMLRPNSPFAIRARFDPGLWAWLIRFARRCNERDMMAAARGIQALLRSSRELYEELIAREGLECEWERRGLLYVYRDRGAFEAYAPTERLLREGFGEPGGRIEGTELVGREPALRDGLAGGWFYEEDAHLRPDRLMRAWRRALERRGVEIREGAAFRGFEGTTGEARAARTAGGMVEGDVFVVAAGAWTPMLNAALGCRVPIQPGKGYSLTMPRPGVCPGGPLIFPETRVAVTPFRSGFRLGSTMEFAGFDEAVRPERLRLLREGAQPYLREPYGEVVEEAWCGWRPMTWDSLPIIDRAPGLGNVVIAAGHNMLGLSMAPATGRLVMEMVEGREPHVDPGAYRVGRF